MDEDKKIEERKEKIKAWLKDPYNLALIGILLFALAIRLYYFWITKNQPLWWDEAEYMATAKHWAFGAPYDINPQRPPLFQALSALIFAAGFGESLVKLLLVVLPSAGLTVTIYLLGREMFNKKAGLIAAFLSAVSWTFVFWGGRFQPDFLSMAFQMLAIMFMWRYWKEPKTKIIVFSAVCAAAGFYFKISALLIPIIFFIFIIVKDRKDMFKNKNYYYFALAYLVTLLPYCIWAYFEFGNAIAIFQSGYSNQAINPTIPFAWYTLNYFYLLTEGLLFVLFILGLVLSMKFVLYIDTMIKNKEKCFNAELFSLISLVVISAFYIFYIRGAEDRWVFLWLPFIFFMIGNIILFFYARIMKYTKIIAIIATIVLLVWGAYAQLSHASNLIENKKESYAPVKESGLWIRDMAAPGDIVLSISYTQTTYYSERKVTTYSAMNETDFEIYIAKNKPKFLVVSIFEPHPQWIFNWTDKHSYNVMPVKAYFADSEKKKPVLIVYLFNWANNQNEIRAQNKANPNIKNDSIN